MNEQTGLIADAAVTNGEVSQLEAERAAGRSGAHLFISAPPDSLLYSVYLQASAQRARPYRLVKAQTERWWFDFERNGTRVTSGRDLPRTDRGRALLALPPS